MRKAPIDAEALALQLVQQTIRDSAMHTVVVQHWPLLQRLDLYHRMLGRVDKTVLWRKERPVEAAYGIVARR